MRPLSMSAGMKPRRIASGSLSAKESPSAYQLRRNGNTPRVPVHILFLDRRQAARPLFEKCAGHRFSISGRQGKFARGPDTAQSVGPLRNARKRGRVGKRTGMTSYPAAISRFGGGHEGSQFKVTRGEQPRHLCVLSSLGKPLGCAARNSRFHNRLSCCVR